MSKLALLDHFLVSTITTSYYERFFIIFLIQMPFVPASDLDCAVPTALQYIIRNTRYV